MHRLAALALAVALVATGCSGDDDADDASPETSTTTSTTAAPVVESVTIDDRCTGIGAPLGAGEVTWLAGADVMTASPSGDARCIATYTGPASLEWSGAADRLLLGERTILDRSGEIDLVPDGHSVVAWSRPTGRAVVVRDVEGEDVGGLIKLSLVGEPELPLGLPPTNGEVLYHPSGTAMALVADNDLRGGVPELLLADNRGQDVRWLVTTETADDIDHLAFTADGAIVFTATHGPDTHLHRLVLGSETLETLLASSEPIGPVVASPWDDELVAAGRGECGSPKPLWLLGDEDAGIDGTPVGWLPDGSLVVLDHDDGCDDEPGDLYVVRDGEPTLVAEDVEAAAVRAELPPPLPPPPDIEAAPA